MKKFITIMLIVAAAAIAEIKPEFQTSVEENGCTLVKWEAEYIHESTKYKHFAVVECNDPQNMPMKIAGLKFFDLKLSSNGKYWYFYGEM